MPPNCHVLTQSCVCGWEVCEGYHILESKIASSACRQHELLEKAYLKCLKVGRRGVSIIIAPKMSTYVLHTAQRVLPLHLQTHAWQRGAPQSVPEWTGALSSRGNFDQLSA